MGHVHGAPPPGGRDRKEDEETRQRRAYRKQEEKLIANKAAHEGKTVEELKREYGILPEENRVLCDQFIQDADQRGREACQDIHPMIRGVIPENYKPGAAGLTRSPAITGNDQIGLPAGYLDLHVPFRLPGAQAGTLRASRVTWEEWRKRMQEQETCSVPVDTDKHVAAFQARRKTPPLTEQELADHNAYVRALDPDGEVGVALLNRHLRAMDVVKELCKKNPNKPKVKEMIRAEFAACEADQQQISKEAYEKREEKIRFGVCVESPFTRG